MKTYFRIVSMAVLLISAMVANAQAREFNFSNSAQKEGLSVEQNSRSGLTMRHALKQVNLINISDNGYTGDVLQGGADITLPANAGEPNLPSFSRFVAIPNGATAHVEIGYRSMTTVSNVDLLPAAPIRFDTDDTPNTYEKDLSIYNKNAFFPEQPVSISEPFNLRGVQTVALTVTPYQYNPVTKELRIYDDLQFNVRFDGGNGEFGDTRLRSPYWDPILMQNLANYNQLPAIDYEARMQEWVTNRPEGCEYLIVIPNNESFRQYANQLKEYRIKQGILTEVKSLSDMGCTSTDQMKSYFHNAYNNWDIPPVAVLLLGDHNTNMSVGVPAEYTYHSSTYGNCITDNGYADVTGDLLPEMAFSRLVAANATEAQMMVSKQIEYEYTNPNMNASTYDQPITALGWQTQRWFQICSEVVGGYWRLQGKNPVRINAIYQGTPGNSWSSNQNTYMVVNYFGPNGLGYIPATPSELGGWTGGTAAQVVNAVNNGAMLLQHRDHGYYQGWGEPDFSTSNVAQMNNVGKLTFVNTINCQTGTFDYNGGCLIEAFMRRTYNNQNAGAVGCIGPTQTSYSFVNDAYAWGMYDQYDPQFMPDYGPYAEYEGNWRPAFGNVAGKYFLQQSSWPYNSNNKAITHKMFTAHCDAFLTLYTEVPATMSVTHPSQITSSTTSINVTAPQGAVIALTRDNNILAVATATGGSQSISFAAQPSNTTITIVATKQNYLRYVGSILVISEPELTVTEMSLNDENGNGELEYSEQSSFDFTIKNTGNLASTLASATLTTDNPMFVTINQNSSNIPALQPNASTTLEDVFDITVSDAVPNGTQLGFILTMTDSGHTWRHNFNLVANAPNLKVYDHFTINDQGSERGNGNGRLDPGENAILTFSYDNNGNATANNVIATLSTSTQEYITINQPTITTPVVGAGETIEVSYAVSVAATMPKGESAEFTLQVTAGAYSNNNSFSHRVGLDFVNFENGMGELEWENDPEHPWTITSEDPYSGQYCLQSGNIGNNETSTLSLQFIVENEFDEIRFFRKTNCDNSDYLKFYIDGTQIQQWNGSLNWREVTFPVTQGEHTFSWTYEKDATGTSGHDHVWIDEILFPVRHITFACNAGADQDICYQSYATLEGVATGYESLLWTTDGDGQFSQPDSLYTTYTPGSQDIAEKHVTLTLTATNEDGETLSDDIQVIIHDAAHIEMEESGEVCEGEDFELYAMVTEAEQIIWSTLGDGQFDNPNEPNTTYTPGPQDITNGNVTLTLNANSSCGNDEKALALTIHPLQHTETEVASCGPYNWNGIVYDEAGDYEQTLTSIFGCDSTVVMHLSMVDSYSVEVEQEACESFEWNGTTYTESGIYEQTFASIYGCDSIVTMQLTVNYINTMEINVEACESFIWDGIEYTESGDYERVYTNTYGCDSIVTMRLSIDNAPMLENIDGDTEVDVRLVPSSEYTTASSTGSYQWSLEPEEAGVITGENHQASVVWSETYKGEAVIKVEAVNDCGQDENSLTITVKNSTGIEENGINAKIYPNPTNSMVTIEAERLQRITISNALGQTVYDREVEAEKTQVEMAQFGNGTYIIRIYTENGILVKHVNVMQ